MLRTHTDMAYTGIIRVRILQPEPLIPERVRNHFSIKYQEEKP